ncbi:MAG: SusC/RagA family TonB-linked outer membrane protein [Cyclobacteriaceae bacterium]|nr:SusC/RagA family TonB-linked outer membrane protein [Cyclobacteriaceae bacterium]
MRKTIRRTRIRRWIMRVSLIQLFILSMSVSLLAATDLAGQEILEKKITISIKTKSLEKALKEIEKEANVRFLYLSNIVESRSNLEVSVKDEPLENLLSMICNTRNLRFELDGDFIILTKRSETAPESGGILPDMDNVSAPATFKVSGVVSDENGDPLPGTSILEKGTTNGTIAGAMGDYVLEIGSEDAVLAFSFVGYLSDEVSVNGRSTINISLIPDISSLEEIVVIGYGTQKKSNVIGSVSTVKGQDLNMSSISNFDAGLQGMASGVSVLSQSGKLGAPSSIKIRGANSITLGTEPLWVIDGMPVFNDPNGVGSSNQNPMSLINPNDIESITVLKDAAALSIYGSRGSNGVIIVTTKTGKAGQGSTSINLTTGISEVSRKPSDVGYANTDEWFAVMDQATLNSTDGKKNFNINDAYRNMPNSIPEHRIGRDVINVLGINTNWYDEAFRNGTFTDLNVSSSRGFDKGAFYLSGNYRTDKGVVDYNQLDRFSLRSNLSFEPLEHFTLDAKVNLSYTNNERRDDDLTTITKWSLPWMPVNNPNNTTEYWNPYTQSNIVARNDPENTLNNVKQYRALGNLSLVYQVPGVNGLSVKSEFMTDIIQSNLVIWRGTGINLDGDNNPIARAEEETVSFTSINYNVYPSYTRDFGLNSISVLMGVEAQRNGQYIRRMVGQGLSGTYQELGIPGQRISMQAQLKDERYLLGFFGRLNYTYDNRYMFGISARRDGSSVFSPDFRWGNFVAFSGGWVLSEEHFMSWLGSGSYLKIRASFGETGNQNVPPNLQVINYFQEAAYGSLDVASNGTVPTNLPVTDLKWETTKSTDIGIDFGFMDDRINGTVGYYSRFIEDMFLEKQLPSSAGVSPSQERIDYLTFRFLSDVDGTQTNRVWSNIGNMVNSGLELELNSTNIDKEKFRWSTSFNISFNSNIIKQLTPELNETGLTSPYHISKTNNKRHVWYVADYAGVDTETGVPYIYALDKDVFVATGETMRVKTESGSDSLIYATVDNLRDNRFIQGQKSSDPVWYGGFTNTLEYGGFDFKFLLSFSGGDYILDYDRQVSAIPNPNRQLLSEVLGNSWQAPGDEARYPRLVRDGIMEIDGKMISGFTDEDRYHNRELYKADFVRLRNVTLGYNLSNSLLNRFKLQGARIYVTANNLWTFTQYPGFDPEGAPNADGARILRWNTPVPQLRSYIVGIDIKL